MQSPDSPEDFGPEDMEDTSPEKPSLPSEVKPEAKEPSPAPMDEEPSQIQEPANRGFADVVDT